MPSRRRRAFARLFGLLTLLWAAPAAAQTSRAGGALDRFDPAPPGDAFLTVPSADVPGRLRIAASATITYAREPLVLRSLASGDTLSWVRDQAVLHAQLGFQLWRRVELDVDLPAVLAVGGTSGSLGPLSVVAPSGQMIGDLRVGARVALLHQRGFYPAIGLTFAAWAPTGKASSFSGAGVPRYQPGVVIGAEYSHFVWGVAAASRFQGESAHTVAGSQIIGSAAAAVRWFGLTVGPEVAYGVSLGDRRDPIVSGATDTNAEAILAARYRIGPLTVGLAGGPGIGRGPGTPRYRLIAGIGGAFDVLPAVADDDGSDSGARAPAPNTTPKPLPPEPPLDTDGDGVPDAEDACPTTVGDPSPNAYRRGCPPDRDHDGIPDAEDRCPDVPGVISADPEKNGCPADTDGDGIPDTEDACPREKGKPSADPKLNGCPTAVRVEGTQIVILQQINFDTGRDTITPDSYGILAQVAAVLADHPEIARVAVDGHTDNRGGDRPNKNLSERRAIAVVRWLVERGVDARRLEARGFGQRRPIADNKDEAGRAKNRRVEFQIRRRSPEGEAGWRDGPVDDAK
jgi:outer membrane protein OmpA-like peptidoglycan-associated protein